MKSVVKWQISFKVFICEVEMLSTNQGSYDMNKEFNILHNKILKFLLHKETICKFGFTKWME